MAERGRGGHSNQEYGHGSNGIIGKFPTLIFSRRENSEESQSDHPGVTTGEVGGLAAKSWVTAPADYVIPQSGCTLHSPNMAICYENRSTNMEIRKKCHRSQTHMFQINLYIS